MAQKRASAKMTNKKNFKPPYIAERVIALRKKFGFSPKDIANELGVTSQAVYQAEKVNGGLLFEVIIFFSLKYQINPAWVIFENNKGISQVITSEPTDNKLSIDELAEKIKNDAAMLQILVAKEFKKDPAKKKK